MKNSHRVETVSAKPAQQDFTWLVPNRNTGTDNPSRSYGKRPQGASGFVMVSRFVSDYFWLRSRHIFGAVTQSLEPRLTRRPPNMKHYKWQNMETWKDGKGKDVNKCNIWRCKRKSWENQPRFLPKSSQSHPQIILGSCDAGYLWYRRIILLFPPINFDQL